jgi:RNA polymerase sigma-70 factor, ECF subfamily
VLLGHLRPTASTRPDRVDPDPDPGPDPDPDADVPDVTAGNPHAAEGVGSGSVRIRQDANQEDT